MRPGPFEIAAIIIVVLLIIIVTRIVRGGRNTANTGKASKEITTGQTTAKPVKIKRRLRVSGIILVIIGIISLLVGVSLLKWLYWSYLWAFIAIVIGFIIIFISRKK